MSKHTPGPWHIAEPGYIASDANGFIPLITPFTAKAHRDMHNGATPEAMANAKFIVRAVNSHDELLSIVRDILPGVDDYADGLHCNECGTAKAQPNQERCDVPGCFYVRIRAAIAKATGEETEQ